MKSRERGDRAGLGHRVGVRRRARARRVVSATPRFDVGGEAERALVVDAPRRRRAPSPGRSRSRRARRPAARSAGSDSSSSRGCPCETTTAATFTRAPRGRPRPCGAPSPPTRSGFARSSPARDERVALGERPAHARRRGRRPRRRRRRRRPPRAAPASSESDDRRAARHRLEHRHAEALVARRQDERGRAPVELGELALVDVAAHVGAARAQLAARAPAPSRARRRRAAGPTASRRVERRERVLARLDRADEEHDSRPCAPSPGEKAGSTPCGVTVIFSGAIP